MQAIWQALDADGNTIETWRGPKKESRIGTTMNDVVVADIQPYIEPTPPHIIRSQIFAQTIDKMNPMWYNTLSEDQVSRLTSWRQEWLDYPETLQDPVTDVSDIFG